MSPGHEKLCYGLFVFYIYKLHRMARIFISYSQSDSALVRKYVEELGARGHEILMDTTVLVPGHDIQSTLKDTQRGADGTIIFLTRASHNSTTVKQEISRAVGYRNRNPEAKFIIPLVYGTDIPISDELRPFWVEKITDTNFADTIKKIETAIKLVKASNVQSSVDTDEKFPNPLHDKVLLFMKKFCSTRPGVTFWLRERNTSNRLNKGFWFQGREDYAFMGLYNGWAGNRSTKSVGLVFWPTAGDGVGSNFSIVYRGEERENYLKFYGLVESELRNTGKLSVVRESEFSVRVDLPGPDGFKSAENFLDVYKRQLDDLAVACGVNEMFISKAEFEEKLTKIEKIRAKLIAGDFSDAAKPVVPEVDDEPPVTLPPTRNSNVNLQIDSPTTIDYLGRRHFVDALTRYIGRLWFDQNSKDSYTIHLSGEWGSGKSTVLSLLREKLQGESIAGSQPWVVAEINAWQNQHISTPWWIFLDAVYRAIQRRTMGRFAIWIWLKEKAWRLFSMNAGKWIACALLLVITFLTMFLGYNFLDLNKLLNPANTENLKLGDKLQIFISAISLIGTGWLFIHGIVNSLLPGGEQVAKNFKEQVRDPMEKIKQHYATIINYTSANVAVFIDDIDRCDPKFVVQFLEGLQTLFRSSKVLYVIAGDSNWIRTSFELHYASFGNTHDKIGQSLGNQFVEKTIQQSVSLPPITDEIKKAYWNALLSGRHESLDESTFQESISKIKTSTSDNEVSEIISNAGSPEEKTILRQMAAEKVSTTKVLEEIQHELTPYVELIEPNPRAMKRLVNNIALAKASNILAGIDDRISSDVIIRWAILKNSFPLIAIEILSDHGSLKKYQNANDHPRLARLLKDFEPSYLEYLTA
jgi:KAP family P-loop domain/TIR domain